MFPIVNTPRFVIAAPSRAGASPGSSRVWLGALSVIGMLCVMGVLGALAGCQSAPNATPAPSPQATAPAPLAPKAAGRNPDDDDRSDNGPFPAAVAGYRRGLIHGMNRGPLDASIGYERNEPDLKNIVTLYLRRHPANAKTLLPHEKALIRQMHSETALLSEQEIALTRNGRNYPALVASFQYTDLFAGQRQALFSQLILVQVRDRVLKVRSTAPAAQAAEAQRNTLRLLNRVSWGPGEPRGR